MNIVDFSDVPLASVLVFWNEAVRETDVLYAPLTIEQIRTLFLPRQQGDLAVRTIVSIEGDQVIGMASGTVHKNKGYLTTVLIDEMFRRKGIGTTLLLRLESQLKELQATTLETVFFNPMNLRWNIPGTQGYQHPNVPGVDMATGSNLFFQHNGYREYAMQDVFARSLTKQDHWKHLSRWSTLSQNGIERTTYDASSHVGLTELFDALHAPHWHEAVAEGLASDLPLLVVLDNTQVIGFAGPLLVETDGRGYFAGIGVHPNYHRKGIGRALFAALCHELADMGASYMTLFTGRENPARIIYEDEGFVVMRSFANLRKTLK